MLEIQSVGWDTLISWPVVSSAALITFSFETGWWWIGTCMSGFDVWAQVKIDRWAKVAKSVKERGAVP